MSNDTKREVYFPAKSQRYEFKAVCLTLLDMLPCVLSEALPEAVYVPLRYHGDTLYFENEILEQWSPIQDLPGQ